MRLLKSDWVENRGQMADFLTSVNTRRRDGQDV